MANFIDDLISKLSEEDQKRLDAHLMGICQSSTSLISRGFDPDDYSLDMVRLIAYQEEIEHDFSRLKKYQSNKSP
jgi:hypothetical protein